MKRQYFPITIASGFKTYGIKDPVDNVVTEYVKGYIFRCAGYFFGVRGETGSWSITELNTGFIVGNAKRLYEVPDALVKIIQTRGFKECVNAQTRYDPAGMFDTWEEVLRPSWEGILMEG